MFKNDKSHAHSGNRTHMFIFCLLAKIFTSCFSTRCFHCWEQTLRKH